MEYQWCVEWLPAVAMVMVAVTFAVMNTIIKKAIDEGMDRLVLVTLRQLVATLVMAPLAHLHERTARPKLTASIFLHLFFSALLGATLPQYLFFLGLQYTSATFACAFLNMAPVFTFMISLPFGLERLDMRTKTGIVKAIGTAVCLTGTMLTTFYKGMALTNTSLVNQQQLQHYSHMATKNKTGKWMMGSITLLVGSLTWSSWFVLQSRTVKKYPAIYSCTTLIFLLSFLQAGALRLATQKDFQPWILTGKLQIITIFFSGIVGSDFGFLVMSWCTGKRGPVFTAAFTPLIQIMVAAIDCTILHGPLYLGSVLGSVLVVAGLYCLLWGKSREDPTSADKQIAERAAGQDEQTV